jgi:hypothetical protein
MSKRILRVKINNKISRIPLFLVLACLIIVSLACKVPALPTPTPTATLLAEVNSPFKSNILGQWKIINGGTWGGATLTFSDDGSFSVLGGLQEKDAKGSYYFTSDNEIAFRLPNYQGTATIEFDSDNQISLTVITSDQPFGLIYSAEKIE